MERLILLPGLLAICDGPGRNSTLFSIADKNGDGVSSIKEVKVSLPTFEVADTNADGLLNQAEAEAAIPGLKFSANGFAGGTGLVFRI